MLPGQKFIFLRYGSYTRINQFHLFETVWNIAVFRTMEIIFYCLDWLQSPVIKYFFLKILFGNPQNFVPHNMFGASASGGLITKTCLYNIDPLKPEFYIVKLGLTGVYISFLISALNIDCGYSLEPPRRGGSNEYPQSMFLSENFQFLEVKFSIYLNRCVFVMCALWLRYYHEYL